MSLLTEKPAISWYTQKILYSAQDRQHSPLLTSLSDTDELKEKQKPMHRFSLKQYILSSPTIWVSVIGVLFAGSQKTPKQM